jgi:lipoprotein NlpD
LERHIRSTGLLIGVIVLALAVSACRSRPAPIYERSSNPYRKAAPSVSRVERPSQYVVRRGDTLYSIAFRYGLDFKSLAAWNGIGAPFVIYPDQRLRLTQPRTAPATRTAAAKPQPSTSQPTRATSKPIPTPSTTTKPTNTQPQSQPTSTSTRSVPAKAPSASKPTPGQPVSRPSASSGAPDWHWPADGKLLSTFASNDPGRKGIDIAGSAGAAVKAAAAGEVVYSGVGLIGYGELIIIKHDQHFLSAYGHNRKRLVNEGDTVRKGQRIAEMGSTGADRPMLHFEVRRDGKPVDPLRYLPKR